jgi:glycosyltransferase involved in cell wall biosynthesis
LKIACVVHRFGTDIAGGSEAHCRAIAEHLAQRHDVTVLTTSARDHVTWHNDYESGTGRSGPLTVKRFPVLRPRSMHRFAEISEVVFTGKASEDEQERWFKENGPESPALLDHLRRHGAEYDRVLFWAFRYATTYFGLPIVADRAVLLPTAEEDPVMRIDLLERFFGLPKGLAFLTPEEAELVARRRSGPLPPSCVIGCGIEPPTAQPPVEGLAGIGVERPFVLYLGRIDPNKGCEALVADFTRYHAEEGGGVSLVMAGPANMPIPRGPAFKILGFVSDDVREALLAHAAVLVVPSLFESLSMVLLEAWNHGVPVLVNGRCAVLKGQVTRANGGLYYRSYDEFSRGLRRLLGTAAEGENSIARGLGRQGQAYVEREYRWPKVMGTLEAFLEGL